MLVVVMNAVKELTDNGDDAERSLGDSNCGSGDGD